MAEKKMFATRIDKDILKSLKLLSVHTEKSMATLLEEAILELVKKYKKEKPFNLDKMP
ncbi:MAG: ribbon-helix-helix domain-containing protein [Deltaproteobacteria bacterium]|jgi:predicted DNA-binding protein|nr:ribbon-helix-helix domain-containing protein [Deltaproteobacteria bacterium]